MEGLCRASDCYRDETDNLIGERSDEIMGKNEGAAEGGGPHVLEKSGRGEHRRILN